MADATNPDKVSLDSKYQEMYAEMRRFRDYELSIANWYSSFLLAIIGGLIVLTSTKPTGLTKALVDCFLGKVAVGSAIMLLGFVGFWSSRYATARYFELRKHVNGMEPVEFQMRKRWFGPGTLIAPIPLIMGTIAFWILLYPLDCRDWTFGIAAIVIAAFAMLGVYLWYPASSE